MRPTTTRVITFLTIFSWSKVTFWPRKVEEISSRLSRAGIPSPYDKVPTMFSYDAATVEDIRKRNPLVRNEFIFPTPGRPFPTLGFTLLGPTSLLPLNKDNRTYSILESNPLYKGSYAAIGPLQCESTCQVKRGRPNCHVDTLDCALGCAERCEQGTNEVELKEKLCIEGCTLFCGVHPTANAGGFAEGIHKV